MTVGFNLTPRDFSSGFSISALVGKILAEAGIDGQGLEAEVTEEVIVDDAAVAGELANLRDMGLLLAIDDFG
ncbi:MAG: EAL domain-containing protein, partial [Novosphingobium sp.]